MNINGPLLYNNSMGEIKQKRSTLIHVAYDNDRQLKLVRDTMEQFGMEFEVLGEKDAYDNNISIRSKMATINLPGEIMKFLAFGAGIILVLFIITALININGVDLQAPYK